MGDKRPSIRTLPSGERVTHHPPDDRHPEGRQVLVQGADHCHCRKSLDAAREGHREQLAANHERHQDWLANKKAALEKGGVPASKRCC